ncbi:MAG: 50S ribosomal protein L5 [Candidatus Omnitrophica bacterium CG1_02_49_10]|nr:MAG: 50S ribosomal protein L5 [Candidatus Omnitrophica bacterium CG1_02_49_10]
MARLLEKFNKEISPELMKKLGIKNKLSVPRPVKVVINVGVGDGSSDIKFIEATERELAAITGQKPIVTRAKKDISNFKIRAAAPIGVKVTLRSKRMYEFLDRLFNVAIPRIRDFKGMTPDSYDGRGGYTFGVIEQSIFPEIDRDKIQKARGMSITIQTTAKSKEEMIELLSGLGMTFKKG